MLERSDWMKPMTGHNFIWPTSAFLVFQCLMAEKYHSAFLTFHGLCRYLLHEKVKLLTYIYGRNSLL